MVRSKRDGPVFQNRARCMLLAAVHANQWLRLGAAAAGGSCATDAAARTARCHQWVLACTGVQVDAMGILRPFSFHVYHMLPHFVFSC